MSDDKVLVSRVLLEKWRTRFRSAQMFTQSTEISEVLAQPSDGALTNEGAEPVAWMDPRSPEMHATISNEVKQHNIKFGGAPAGAVSGYSIPLYRHPSKVCTCPSGDGSLRWPCPVHPPEVKAGASFAEGIEAAAKLIERRMDEYVNEHGSYDHDTGHTEFPGTGEETVEEWMNLAESIRAITS